MHLFADPLVPELDSQEEAVVLKHKKNFKIWFSPRSRKVRCKVEKPLEVTVPEKKSSGEQPAAQSNIPTAQCQDLSVFNFTSSSQDSSSSQSENNVNRKGKKRSKKIAAKRQVQGRTSTTRKHTKENIKKKRLEAINQQWGITGDQNASSGLEPSCVEGARRSSKRVSFLSPSVTTDEAQTKALPVYELSLTNCTIKKGLSGGEIDVPSNQSQHGQSTSSERMSTNGPNSKKGKNTSPQENAPKRNKTEERNCTMETTPKRQRAPPGQRRKSPGGTPSISESPMNERNKKQLRADEHYSPSIASQMSSDSHNKSLCSPRSSVGRSSPGTPAVLKRNHKGETPLHLAAIKVKTSFTNSQR